MYYFIILILFYYYDLNYLKKGKKKKLEQPNSLAKSNLHKTSTWHLNYCWGP